MRKKIPNALRSFNVGGVTLFLLSVLSYHCAFPQMGEWTFMKGDSIGGNPGNYGTQGVPSVTNHPPAFYEACEWTDLQGNFWMYGGLNLGASAIYPNAMWKFDPFTNMWTWMQGSLLSWQVPVFGTKGISSPSNTPGTKFFGNCTFTDTIGNLWLIFGYSNPGGEYNTLWKYDIGINEWTWMSGDTISWSPGQYGTQGIPSINNIPPGRSEAVTAWVDNQNNFWTFGGSSFAGGGNMNDLWRYTPSTGEWTWMKGSSSGNAPTIYGNRGISSATNQPGGRTTYTKWKDAQDNLWFFGGAYGVGGPSYSDLWKYDKLTNEFAWMSGDSGTYNTGLSGASCVSNATYYPSSREENKACWTDECHNFWMMGGTNSSYLADLWKYSPVMNEWTLVYGNPFSSDIGIYGIMGVSSPLNRPPSRNGTSAWKDQSGNLWLFGGYVSRSPYPCMSDLWKYVPDTTCGGCTTLQPTAQFSADNHICPGTCVDFSNLSANATSYQWTFSGATPASSTDMNPVSICYSTPGTFDVTLIAANANAIDTLTLVNYITVYPYPQPQAIQQNGDTLIANQGALNYQWYFNGNLIAGATDYFYVALQSGDYNVVATDANGCEVEAVIFNVVAGLTSALSEGGWVMVFPNPVVDKLIIQKLEVTSKTALEISIYNLVGEIVYRVHGTPCEAVDCNLHTVDCRFLPQGTYWIEISDGKRMMRKHFVKQ